MGEYQPPVVQHTTWPQSPIDHFILNKLEESPTQPRSSADKLTLLRRATFDLTGLPPTPAEIESFLGDHTEEAFKSVVERLLESPHYGERWGRRRWTWLALPTRQGMNPTLPIDYCGVTGTTSSTLLMTTCLTISSLLSN